MKALGLISIIVGGWLIYIAATANRAPNPATAGLGQ